MSQTKRSITAEVRVLEVPKGQDFSFKFASSTSYLIYGIKLPFVDHEPCSASTLAEAEQEAQEKALARCSTLAAIFNQILNQAIEEIQSKQAPLV